MRELVDILVVVSILSLTLSGLLGLYVLAASLMKSTDVSDRFFSSRRFLPVRIVRFFSTRRYVDTMEPGLVKLGSATVYLARAGLFFTAVTAALFALVGR
jgi:hypothetical protein